jgi:rod shape-determining protein MreC
MTWRRLALIYLGLLAVSLMSTRFLPDPPLALSSGIAPITALTIHAAEVIHRDLRYIARQRTLEQNYRRLRRKYTALNAKYLRLRIQAAREKAAAQIRNLQSPGLVGIAQVIGVSTSPLLARLTINRGSADGIHRFMPVTVPQGLVGQVVQTSRKQAEVITLVDPRSRVGVTVPGLGGQGVAVGRPPGELEASFPTGLALKVGDPVVTDSLGGVYPTGIPVGTIAQVLPPPPNGILQHVLITPDVNVNDLEEVAILQAL